MNAICDECGMTHYLLNQSIRIGPNTTISGTATPAVQPSQFTSFIVAPPCLHGESRQKLPGFPLARSHFLELTDGSCMEDIRNQTAASTALQRLSVNGISRLDKGSNQGICA